MATETDKKLADERNQKKIELIKFDKESNICYEGIAKTIINLISGKLIVKPIEDNGFEKVTASLEWKFVAEKNILFVCADKTLKSFALVFDTEVRCKLFFGTIKPKRIDGKEKFRLIKQFLTRVFNIIGNNSNAIMISIFAEWLKGDKGQPKNEYLQLTKKNNVFNLFFQQNRSRKNLKRKHSEIVDYSDVEDSGDRVSSDKNKFVQQKPKFSAFSVQYTKVIKYPNFKVMNIQERGSYRRLIIFTDSNSTKCYEYIWYSRYSRFFCHGCQLKKKNVTAIIDQDEDGNVCIKLDNAKHVCKVRSKVPSNYTEIIILRKPDYKVETDPSKIDEKVLIVFDPKDRNKCYEYYWFKKTEKFYCRGCHMVKIKANICHEGTEKEYIELENANHVCEKRQYQSGKYFQYNEFLLPPNFVVHKKQKKGQERKTLVIFDKNDASKCYHYFYNTPEGMFECNGCHTRRYVTAKLMKNADGEEYVIPSNTEHICEPVPYNPDEHSDEIIRSSNFKYLEVSKSGIPKLFIFTPQKFCYEFSFAAGINTTNRFYCRQCLTVANREGKNFKLNAYLCKNSDDGENYVRMSQKKHICKPRKYDSDQFEVKEIAKSYDFFFYRLKKNDDALKVAVINPKDKKLCYQMSYSKAKRLFRCQRCEAKKNYFPFKIQKDEESEGGKEYFVHNHICKPHITSEIRGPKIVIVDRKDINFEDKTEKKVKVEEVKEDEEIDESKIVRVPNFELHTSRNGKVDGKLIVFSSDDKTMCFEYHLCANAKHKFFRCGKCAKNGGNVTAKMIESKNEKYLVLSDSKHTCQPVKYVLKEIKSTDFKIYNKDDDSKPTYLIVFTTQSRDLCYEFTYLKSESLFRCRKCIELNRAVTAKSYKDKNGEEYFKLARNQHICNPVKFAPEKYEPKTLPQSMFELHTNRADEKEKLLVVFTTEKKDFVFHYYWFKENKFCCSRCKNFKKFVTARVCVNESGEKYLELSPTEHGCEPQKYDPENYKDKDELYDGYRIQYDANGTPNDRLIIWDFDDKNLGYEYVWQKDKNVFICLSCLNLKKGYISARVAIDENGKEFLRLGKQQHVCKIRNLRDRGLIFNENEYNVTNENTVITAKHPKCKNISYKFEYDPKMEAFCCVKCKEKKKFITATVCKDKKGNDFLLMNDKHKCVT